MSDTGFSIEDGKTLLSEAFAPWVLAQNLMPKSFSKTTATFVLPANDDLALRGGPGAGLICGQAIAAAADTATVIALAGANGRFRNCTTVDLSVNYLRPLPMGDTNITVEIESNGRKLATCRLTIQSEGSPKPAALATATFMYLED
ncbi:PaaI family thioesterase [Amylibacter sp. IMCC11727]|uniref:PaaI family thioesterase n=1 Tax=Amylibacter sp. IMCC11727 TaxID=3039851 RepID=UPI00244E58E5|nr:PaaI family thioesterase [Amylibacter sp. IMCC11727]WGI22271.1 PaaI family thioesterase [Amylibacter sp. IMCC11727]